MRRMSSIIPLGRSCFLHRFRHSCSEVRTLVGGQVKSAFLAVHYPVAVLNKFTLRPLPSSDSNCCLWNQFVADFVNLLLATKLSGKPS